MTSKKDNMESKKNNMESKKDNKKNQVLEKIFKDCKKRGNYEFDNELVKNICQEVGFGNPFDATKIDSKDKLPKCLLDEGFAIIHLGKGRHRFINGIDKVYHDFEPIQEEHDWEYKKSLLNEFNTSESNILSVANNQRILHHFLFEKDREFDGIDISMRPKTYFPHRTKTNLSYNFGKGLEVTLENIQIEIDLTIEFKGTIGVFEGKNGNPKSFAIYQIYHPFLYYHNAKKNLSAIEKIFGVYVVKTIKNNVTKLKIWSYTFNNPYDITTISLCKSACYHLIPCSSSKQGNNA